MSAVLDGLKERLEVAKARLATAQQQYQAAGMELQAATNDHSIWSAAVAIEMREEEKRLSEAEEKQIPMNLPDLKLRPVTSIPVPELDQMKSVDAPEAVNKTGLVREMLREHSTGISPTDLWTELKGQLSSRAYLYSILKRLRDKDEVFIRRKKYVLRPKLLEVKNVAEAEITH